MLSVNAILFTYRTCSMWLPSTSIHFVYRLIMFLGKIPGISRMTPAVTGIHAIRSCCVSYTRVLPPEMEIQWCQVRWARGPGYWASTSNPSVAKGVIQVETQEDLVAPTQVAVGVSRDMLGIFPRVRHDIIRRYSKCINVVGGHIEHLL